MKSDCKGTLQPLILRNQIPICYIKRLLYVLSLKKAVFDAEKLGGAAPPNHIVLASFNTFVIRLA